VSRAQKIVDLIDVGLQTPAPDPTYGEVSPINRETCARCHRPPADESDWCEGCRAFLLGDREDPRYQHALAERGWITDELRHAISLGVDSGYLFPVIHEVEGQFPDRAAPFEPDPIALHQAAIRFSMLIDEFSRRIVDVGRVLQDVAERFEALERPVDLPRLRHGHAAVCPRHGETRGGTCLRCR
jgi:hypothetical protein